MKNRVSIIIPVYNAEEHLKQCIESVINQTHKEVEIILINDGSTDKSGQICDSYAKQDQRIIVIHKENGGVSSARNEGLKKSTGRYTMFVDSDDWLDTNAVKTLLEIQSENEYEVIMFGSYRDNLIVGKIEEVREGKQSYHSEDKVKDVLPLLIKKELMNSLWNKLYKSTLIKDNNITFDESLNIAEDLLFNFHVFLKTKSFYVLDQSFYHYMIRDEESLTKRYNPKKYETLMFVNNYMQKELSRDLIYIEALQATQHIRIKNIYSCLLDLFSKHYQMSTKEKLRYIDDIIKKEDNEYNYYSDEKLFKILISIFATKNKFLIYATTYLISKLRNRI